jgi:cell division protein FtsB
LPRRKKKFYRILDTGLVDKLKKKTSQKKKTIKRFLFLLLAVFLVYSFFAGPYGFLRLFSLLNEKKELKLEAQKLEARIMEMENRKEKLKSDSFYLEKQAREKLGMSREGEKIYKFVDTTKTSQGLTEDENQK